MPATDPFNREPTREEIDRSPGPVLLEFGAAWCPYCQALAPNLVGMLRDYPAVRHVRIEDGPGQPLGRSFRVKVWPNLVFLRDGQVIQQLARPDAEEVRAALEAITVAS
jgi:thioredoxin 1